MSMKMVPLTCSPQQLHQMTKSIHRPQIPGQAPVLWLEWSGHGRHRWKSIKWLELTGMGNVSAMIQTQLGLITT